MPAVITSLQTDWNREELGGGSSGTPGLIVCWNLSKQGCGMGRAEA